MSKQTSLDAYLHKKKNNIKPNDAFKPKPKHNSSREASEETVRLPDDHESQVKMQVFQKRTVFVSHPLAVITPNCIIQSHIIMFKLDKLQKNYGKEEAINFILGNLRFHKIDNVRNLQSINDDDFWCLTLPKLLQILLAQLPKVSYRRLLTDSPQVVDITRLDALVILGSMFLGIMPKQPHQNCVSFGELMTLKQNQFYAGRAAARCEKLKCIIAYFNIMAKNDQIFDENIRIQRTSNRDMSYLGSADMERQVPLRSVKFQNLDSKAIEDYCGKGIMVDFANKVIGGGVLKNGCVQQEILFAIFPQLIITKMICQQLDQNQAIIVYGARRYADYTGYSDTFKFDGEWPLQSYLIVEKSIFVAIDAIDFSKYPTKNFQYSKKGVRREINKAFAGFQGVNMQADETMPICTGRWGCGAFQGDEYLKFLIQWLAASQANREMIYISNEEDKLKQLAMLYNELSNHTTLDLLSLLDEYYRQRGKNFEKPIELLEYIKNEV